MGRIVQGGEPKLVALASFGGDRESAVAVEPLVAPEARAVGDCQALPYIKGVTPEFTQHIEMRWAFGGMPFSGIGGREMGGWMRSGRRQKPLPMLILWRSLTPGRLPCCHT